MRIYLILIITSLFFVSCLDKFDDIEKDKISPYVESVRWNVNNNFDISREANQSFDKVSEDAKNVAVALDAKIEITFSEEMFPQSLAEYGVSESVVILENEPSKTFLSDIKSPPLSDTDVKKILKAKVYMRDGDNRVLVVDFNDTKECVTENPNEEFCKLKLDRSYSLIVGASASDKNGRTLVVESAKDKTKKSPGNFVLLFKTIGLAPKVIASSPAAGEVEVCPSLKDVSVDFDKDMNLNSITDDSFYLTKLGSNAKIDADITKEPRKALLKLKDNLVRGDYSIHVANSITSKSRMPLEESYQFDFSVGEDSDLVVNDFAVSIQGRSLIVSWNTQRDSKGIFTVKSSATPEKVYEEQSYSKVHNFVIALDKPGVYSLTGKIVDKCGKEKEVSQDNLDIKNHPIISEVCSNSNLCSKEFVEVYNPGDTEIDLSNYKIVALGHENDDKAFTNTLAAKTYYAHELDTNLTKAEDIELRLRANDTVVDKYTYDFKAGAGDDGGKSAQKVELVPMSQNYCEATPTPNAANNCQ